jgi:hypothetical protein
VPEPSLIRSALARSAEWEETAPSARSPFRLICTLAPPLTRQEIMAAWAGRPIRSELLELWTTCGEAELFIDADNGQWGLKILSPAASSARTRLESGERSTELDPGDIVVGEFLGDQELLVVSKKGEPLVALPLDLRSDWYTVGADLGEFLTSYVAAGGEKFWEQAG